MMRQNWSKKQDRFYFLSWIYTILLYNFSVRKQNSTSFLSVPVFFFTNYSNLFIMVYPYSIKRLAYPLTWNSSWYTFTFCTYDCSRNSTDVEAQQALSAPDVLYPGGYYENGLYIVTSTVAPPESWGIIGHDRPCNLNNNNTERSVLMPNCSRLTTIIIPINYTTTTAPLLVTLSSGSRLTNGVLMILPVVLSSCFAGSASVSDM